MNVNNLGGVRMPTTTGVASSSPTARTSFSSLVQGAAGAPAAGRAGLPGSNIIAGAIAVNHGTPGSGFGAPYTQAAPGSPSGASPVHAQAPTAPGAPQPGSEFNGELKAMTDQQQKEAALKEIMKMSFMSFVSGTFSLGSSKLQLESADS